MDGRFRQIFLLLDSDQEGERIAALDRLHALGKLNGWPRFADILDREPTTVVIDNNPAWQAEVTRLNERIAALERQLAAHDEMHVGQRIKFLEKAPGGGMLIGIVLSAIAILIAQAVTSLW